MKKIQIVSILSILFILTLNSNIRAADTDTKTNSVIEENTTIDPEDALVEEANIAKKETLKTAEEKPVTSESSEKPEDEDEEEEPDCD